MCSVSAESALYGVEKVPTIALNCSSGMIERKCNPRHWTLFTLHRSGSWALAELICLCPLNQSGGKYERVHVRPRINQSSRRGSLGLLASCNGIVPWYADRIIFASMGSKAPSLFKNSATEHQNRLGGSNGLLASRLTQLPIRGRSVQRLCTQTSATRLAGRIFCTRSPSSPHSIKEMKFEYAFSYSRKVQVDSTGSDPLSCSRVTLSGSEPAADEGEDLSFSLPNNCHSKLSLDPY